MELPTIEEARLKFPIGTKFSNKNLGYSCDEVEITGTQFRFYGSNTIIVDANSSKRNGFNKSSYTIFKDDKWAEIFKYEPNYEIY